MRIAIDHARFGGHGWARALKDECRGEFGVGQAGNPLECGQSRPHFSARKLVVQGGSAARYRPI
jgi:hypothetical protein